MSRRDSIISASATLRPGSRRQTWDAPVTRFEVGGGYSIQRNLVLKARVSAQYAATAAASATSILGAAQLVFWF